MEHLIALLVLTLAAVGASIGLSRLFPPESCQHCGYSRRGLNDDARCPECGGDPLARQPSSDTRLVLGVALIFAAVPIVWLVVMALRLLG